MKKQLIMKKRNMKLLSAFIFIAPAMIFLVTFCIIPMLYSFVISLLSYNTAMASSSIHFVGFKNYMNVLSNNQFWQSVSWTFIFTISAVALNVILGITLAMLLTGAYLVKITKIFKTIFTLPMMIAPVVIATIWKLVFSPIYGVLNGIVTSFGMDRVNWLSDTIPARIALIVVEVWATTPLCMLIFIAALQTIPTEIMEASIIDGANWRQKFGKITLPLIRNYISLVITMRFMDAIRMFDIVYNLTNGGPGTSTETIASTIYKTAFRYYNVGEGSAGAFLFLLLIILFSFISIKIFGTTREE